jgi:hypothetical protein
VARRYALWRHSLAVPSYGCITIWIQYLDGGGIALVITMIALNLVMYRYHLIDIAAARSLSFFRVVSAAGLHCQ